MSTQKNLFTLCIATVFTLGLAACGGGGGGDAPVAGMMDGDDTDDTMTSSLVGKILPTDTTFTLPEGLVDDTTITVPQGASVPVPGVGTFECVTGPCTVDVASDVVTTTGVIEVVSLAEGLPAEVLTALASITEDAPAGPTPATPEQVTAAAATKVTAIGKVKPDNMPLADVEVTVTAMRAGPDIKVEGDDDFTHVMGPMYSLMHDADDDGNVVQEIVLVDHTITNPKRTSFAKAHPLNLSTDTTNDGEGGDPDTFEALTIVHDDAAVAALVKSDSDAFAAGTGAGESIHKFLAEDTDGMVDAAEVVGTYDGAPGTYRCDGNTDCTVTVTRDAMGKVTTEVSAGWIFTPDENAKVYVVDTEYASFGVWLKRTTDADGVLTYNMVDTFAMGAEATAAVPVEVQGTASYKGSALGVYVHNVLDPAGEVASATGGSFTADAALTATFGQKPVSDTVDTGTIAANQVNTITGTIDNFELAGGEAQKWSVELMRSGEYDETGGVTFTGATKGGGENGKYSGQFYGAASREVDGVTENFAPSTVAGEFTANFLNGNVAGGFGATKQDD